MPQSYNKLFRRLSLVWAMTLITAIVLLTWLRTPDIGTGTVTALATVVGILATVIGFYHKNRARDDRINENTGDS